MQKAQIYFLGTVIALAGSAALVVAPIWDDAAVVDSDLLLSETQPILDADNSYLAMPVASSLSEVERTLLSNVPVYEKGQFVRSGEVMSGAERLRVVADSKNLVNAFLQSANRTEYQCPATFMQYGAEIGSCDSALVLNIARVLILHAAIATEQGDTARAVELTGAALRVGHQMMTQERPGSVVEFMVGAAIMNNALNFLAEAPTVQQFMPDLAPLYTIDSSALLVVLQREYMHTKALMEEGLAKRTHVWYWYQPIQTINEYADFVRAEMRVAATPCDIEPATAAWEEQYQRLQLPGDSVMQLLRPNLIGRAVVSLAVVGLADNLREQACAINAELVQ